MRFDKLFLVFLVFSLTLILLPNTLANFVCGEVKSQNDISPSWLDVDIFYTTSPDYKTSCKVSPMNFRYCCDPLEINSKWSIGREVGAKIKDFENGFFSNAVTTKISGGGFDVFPDLALKKAFSVYEPNRTVFLNKSFNLNLSIYDGFIEFYFLLKNSSGIIYQEKCFNCTHYYKNLSNLLPGNYWLEIIGNEGGENYSEIRRVDIISQLNITRKFDCTGCKNKAISSSPSFVRVNLSLKTDSPVDGILYDLYPLDWELIEGGEVEEYSESHMKVFWNVSGSNIERYYILSPPKTIVNKKYTFKSGLDEYESSEEEYVLFRFIRSWLFSFPAKNLNKKNVSSFSKSYNLISRETPLVQYFNNSDLIEVAFFPKEDIGKAHLWINLGQIIKMDGAQDYFSIRSSIKKDKASNYFNFREKKSLSNGYILKNISLYSYNKNWGEVNVIYTGSDEDYNYYTVWNKTGLFAIKRYYGK